MRVSSRASVGLYTLPRGPWLRSSGAGTASVSRKMTRLVRVRDRDRVGVKGWG